MKFFLAALFLSTTALTAAAADVQPTEAQIAAAMKKADPDGDGTVSLSEARKFGIGERAFKRANPDKDGTLDKKEFMAAVTYQFEQANPDKDGTLDRKEAVKAGIKTKKQFDAANPDHDGTLDLAEYLVALTQGSR